MNDAIYIDRTDNYSLSSMLLKNILLGVSFVARPILLLNEA